MPAISLTIRNTSLEEDVFRDVCDEMLDVLRDLTPVDTGFCRDSWYMAFDSAETTFYNDAEYASYLDDGWSSQAPSGMTGPALDRLQGIIDGYS
jgi:hypothetical protein